MALLRDYQQSHRGRVRETQKKEAKEKDREPENRRATAGKQKGKNETGGIIKRREQDSYEQQDKSRGQERESAKYSEGKRASANAREQTGHRYAHSQVSAQSQRQTDCPTIL